MSKILISGGTGLVGMQLQNLLKSKGHEVSILTRNPKKANEFSWNIKEGIIDENAFANITHIIHLAGAGIADKRWSGKRKQEIIDSRVASANLLFNYVKKLNIKLEGFISASGIGFYGAHTFDTIFKEDDAPYNDFISKVCIDWENAAKQFETLNIPVTILRTGVVLSKEGGALSKMNTPLFLTALGNGKQYFPWIHIDDLCKIYAKTINNSWLSGIYNCTTNNHQTNISFTKALAKATGKILFPLNVPSFILKTVLGELSIILLAGSRISANKIESVYTFEFPDLKEALENLLK
ncbi:TIGR01777 family oxidoreductase [Tenacibaculum xiamenense]|uniref:TIGR01777 family oxidoreductase n=1 Tax=Tenacibaculum xiamenense TaxID=1261553 RepID=UPI003892D4AC